MDIEEIDIGHTSPLRVQDTVNPRFRKQKLQTACEDPSGDNIPGRLAGDYLSSASVGTISTSRVIPYSSSVFFLCALSIAFIQETGVVIGRNFSFEVPTLLLTVANYVPSSGRAGKQKRPLHLLLLLLLLLLPHNHHHHLLLRPLYRFLLSPGVQKIFVQVWGCAHNTSDAEYMAGLLAAYGYDVTLGGAENEEEEEQQQQKVIGINRPKVHHPAVGDSAADCESGCTEGGACCQKQPSQRIPTVTSKASAREAADLWLLNSCTVKGPAEDHFRNAVLEAKAKGKRVVVAGCVPQGSPTAKYLKDVSVIGVQQIDRVVEVVEQTLLGKGFFDGLTARLVPHAPLDSPSPKTFFQAPSLTLTTNLFLSIVAGNTVRFMEKRIDENDPKHRRLGGAPLSLPKIRRNPLIEILAISTGCLNACTYCKTKHARGVLASYPITELVQRAQEAFADGVKEVWLTSEDLGAYGRDLSRSEFPPKIVSSVVASQWPNHLTLADLLINLVPVIPVGCMLRLGMTNPPYILDQLNEIAAVLRHPRVYTFLHVPVQSGSNRVLGAMRREYTVEEFSHVVDFLTKNVNFANPKHKLTIATDLICGFPNETEPDFRETVGLVERYKFPVLYVNQFFARPGTPAATMKREATTAEVKKRTRLLHDFFRSYRPYAGREGLQYRVLITETSTDGLHWVGHTKAYEQVPTLVIVLLSLLWIATRCTKFPLGPYSL
ncbi:unnamed protein product [Schistocephalus solidus]|uniref:Threonylcarbamoyladenosine tRNA methylthiotransferase n=1 Tax=Schistocephalus solidus TaxID=70667 RepID=A0A183SUI1_SCHSO|nr:unnamed protein product [Schistocephalus solidus]